MDVKTNNILSIILAAIMVWGLSESALAGGSDFKGKQAGGVEQLTLSSTEAETLTFMREEEKLARDVYLVHVCILGFQNFHQYRRVWAESYGCHQNIAW